MARAARGLGGTSICASLLLLLSAWGPSLLPTWGDPPAPAAAGAATDLFGDPLPPGATARIGTVRLRHPRGMPGMINALAFSPDDKLLASARGQNSDLALTSLDNTVCLWEVATGRCLRRFEGHTTEVKAVAFSPDGHELVSASKDTTTCTWDPSSGAPVRQTSIGTGAGFDLRLSGDGRRLIWRAHDGMLHLWEIPHAREEEGFPARFPKTAEFAIAPDGRWLATWGGQQPLRVHELDTGRVARQFDTSEAWVSAVAFSATGASVLVSTPGRTTLWDLMTGRVIRTYPWTATCLAFSHDDRTIAAGGRSGVIRLWRADSGEEIGALDAPANPIVEVSVRPDGKELSTTEEDGSIGRWDLSTGRRTGRQDAPRSAFREAHAFTPDGEAVAYVEKDNLVHFFDLTAAADTARLESQDGAVCSLSASPDGKTLALGTDEGVLLLWEPASGRTRVGCGEHSVSSEGSRGIRTIAFSPQGQTVATGGQDGTICLWDVPSGTCRMKLLGHEDDVLGIRFGPDGTRLASGGKDGTVRLWSVATGAELRRLEGPSCASLAAEFTPGHRVIGVSSVTVPLGAARAGRAIETGLHTLAEGPGSVPAISLAFSPDGRLLASGWADRRIRIWDPTTGRHRRTFEGHCGPVSALAFAPDGRRLVSGSWDATALVWELDTPAGPPAESPAPPPETAVRPVARTDPDGDPLPPQTLWRLGSSRLCHAGPVRTVLFSPDGGRIASGGDDGMLRIWEAASGRPLQAIAVSPGRRGIGAAAFDATGRRIISGAGALTFWEIPSKRVVHAFDLGGHYLESVAISADGTLLAMVDSQGQVRRKDLVKEREPPYARPDRNEADGVAFTSDGRIVVSNRKGRIVTLREPRTWERVAGIYGIDYLGASRDGKIVAAGDDAGIVHLLAMADGAVLRDLPIGADTATAVDFSNDGSHVACGMKNGTIVRWEVATGKEVQRIPAHLGETSCLVFSPDGKTLASGGVDGRVRLWDVGTGRGLHPQDQDLGEVQSLAFAPDGLTLASADAAGTSRTWDLRTGVEARHWAGKPRDASAIVFPPDGIPAVLEFREAGATLADPAAATASPLLREASSACFGLSADGRVLACKTWDGSIVVWDVPGGREIGRLHGERVRSLAVAPDGRRLALGGCDGTVRTREVATGREETCAGVHGWQVTAVGFTPDGNRLVSYGEGRLLHLWDLATRTRLREVSLFDAEEVETLASSRDGRRVATASEGGCLRVWDTETGRALFKFAAEPVTTRIALSPDGGRLAAANGNGTVLVFDLTRPPEPSGSE